MIAEAAHWLNAEWGWRRVRYLSGGLRWMLQWDSGRRGADLSRDGGLLESDDSVPRPSADFSLAPCSPAGERSSAAREALDRYVRNFSAARELVAELLVKKCGRPRPYLRPSPSALKPRRRRIAYRRVSAARASLSGLLASPCGAAGASPTSCGGPSGRRRRSTWCGSDRLADRMLLSRHTRALGLIAVKLGIARAGGRARGPGRNGNAGSGAASAESSHSLDGRSDSSHLGYV